METDKISKQHIALAVLSGLLLSASFPKAGISWLAWFAIVPLLVAISDLTPKRSFQVGFLAGSIHYLSLLYWVAYTAKIYGRLPLVVAVSILFLFAAFLGLYIAGFSAILTRTCKGPVLCPVAIPVLWVFMEYGRSFLFTGFPWGLIGYSQFKALHIIQISDILGVYGVSFLVAVVNAAILLGILSLIRKTWRDRAVSGRIFLLGSVIAALVFGMVWYYGVRSVRIIDERIAASPHKRIAVVQANIDQEKKWDPAFQEETVRRYINLSLLSKPEQADLVVWPETATPFYFLHNQRLSEMVKSGIRRTGSDFLIGSPSFLRKKNTEAYYNSAYLVGRDGKVHGKYDKVHLVPFGEYVPLKRWLPFLGKMVEQVGDFRPGVKGKTLDWGRYRLGVQICYEIIFPGLSRAMVNNGSDVLVNITNDAWFGRTSAPFQHFSMTIFRAIERNARL